MFRETLRMHGALDLVLRDKDGSIKEALHKDNLVVDVGFDFIADAIGKPSGRPNVMSHIALGTDSTAAAAGQTALITEISRVAATYDHTVSTKVFSFTSNFAAGVATGALTEAGVVNAASSGIFLDRVTFPVVNKGADDTLEAIFTFTMS